MTDGKMVAGMTNAEYQRKRKEKLELTKLEFQATRSTVESIDLIRDLHGIRSRGEVVRRAVKLLTDVLVCEDARLYVRYEDGREV